MKVEQVRKASNIAEITSFGSYNNIYVYNHSRSSNKKICLSKSLKGHFL